jgi:non-specific serine/threonine protein kinase
VLDLLGALVDHSLVVLQAETGENRYAMLETIRQYAFENLNKSHELSGLRIRHLDYFLHTFFNRRLVYDPISFECFDRWELDYPNLREAMEHAIASNLEVAVELCGRLIVFCEYREHRKESYNWAVRIYQLARNCPARRVRAMALWLVGERISFVRGEFARGEILVKAAVDIARELDDKYLLMDILQDFWWIEMTQGNPQEAITIAEERLKLREEITCSNSHVDWINWQLGQAYTESGNRERGRRFIEKALSSFREVGNTLDITYPLISLAEIERYEHNNGKAIELYSECVAIQRKEDRFHLISNLISYGFVFLEEGRIAEARALLEESISVWEELKISFNPIRVYIGMARVAASLGKDENAVRLLGAAQGLAENTNITLDAFTHRVYDPLIAELQTRLGEVEYKRLWEEGCKLTLEEAIELAEQ